MKKIIAMVLAVCMVLTLFAACASTEESSSSEASSTSKSTVAILMPIKEQPIWLAYGNRMKEAFEKKGYDVILEFAEDAADRQLSQIENAVMKGAKHVILGPVDSYAVSDSVEKAKEAGSTIISCDRLIMNTDAVDYYVTFDLFHLGELQGQYIEKSLKLDQGETGPFNLEIFSGSTDDPNSLLFYNGAMKVLKPYIDAGKLVVKSGQADIAVNGTLKWDTGAAQARMDNILASNYSDARVDAVLAAADCLALGVISSLTSLGYGSEDKPFPVITGQDCEITAIKNIMDGKQSMSVFLDATIMAEKMLSLVETLEKGEKPATDATYNNNNIDIPTILYEPVVIDKTNTDLLIERGFYTKEDLGM